MVLVGSDSGWRYCRNHCFDSGVSLFTGATGKMNNLQQQLPRRKELLLKENEKGLDIEERIELHELDEDIKIAKFLVLFRAGTGGYD